jgi:hypothetical protein
VGTWGVGILDNDAAADVHADCGLLLRDMSPEKTLERMMELHGAKLKWREERNNFWFGIACAQLDAGVLQQEVYEQARTCIASGADLELWRELKASERDIQARSVELNGFLARMEAYMRTPPFG